VRRFESTRLRSSAKDYRCQSLSKPQSSMQFQLRWNTLKRQLQNQPPPSKTATPANAHRAARARGRRSERTSWATLEEFRSELGELNKNDEVSRPTTIWGSPTAKILLEESYSEFQKVASGR